MPNPSPAPDNLLLFTPHVPRRVTTTGWTADRQVAFIAALARTGVVSAAARSVGMSARAAYALRMRVRHQYSNWADRPMTPAQAEALGPGYIYSFAAAWDVALDRGLLLQMESALPVALEGEEVPVIRRGRIIGWQTRFDRKLAINALGAFRRYHEGDAYDHELRTAERSAVFLERIEARLRLGAPEWPDPMPPESPEDYKLRLRREREEERVHGPRIHGLLDPHGPADQPPRIFAVPPAKRVPPPPPHRRAAGATGPRLVLF